MPSVLETFWNNITAPDDFIALGNKYFLHLTSLDRTEDTIHGIKAHLKQFTVWCRQREIHSPLEVSSYIIDMYQSFVAEQRNPKTQQLICPRYRKNLLNAVKGFYAWLVRSSYIAKNPTDTLESIKVGNPIPHDIFTVEELEKIMLQPNTNTLPGKRDRVILELAYATAMRRMEISNLNVDDIDFEREVIFIKRGKGKKDRVIPLGKRARYYLSYYINEVRPLYKQKGNALFFTAYETRVSPSRVRFIVTKHIKAAKIGKRGSTHKIRHSVATLMLENGSEIRYVQAFLGHAKLSTTQIYTRVSIAKLKEVHTKTHPARMYPTKTQEILDEINEK